MKEAKGEYMPHDMDARDRVRIKIQFEALGLINVSVSATTEGGFAEFLSLTARGREILVHELVARKS